MSGAGPHSLLLGSFPGERSLKEGRYYAHPRNAFWSIMGRLFNAGPELPYEERLERLSSVGIALWDVLLTCRRTGSMDGSIIEDGAVPNDLLGFFLEHPTITAIFFNGQKAARLFERLVTPGLGEISLRIERKILPSTSPAYASKSLEQKIEEWSVLPGAGPPYLDRKSSLRSF